MAIDRYTKIVLTVVALALSAIAIQGGVGHAQAQFGQGCGASNLNPCYIDAADVIGLKVVVTNMR